MALAVATKSSRKGAEGTVLVSALVVGSVWAYRKLIEPSAQAGQLLGEDIANRQLTEAGLRKIIGLEPTPASAAQFTVAFGFTFFTLSIMALAVPELAAAFAILIATGDVLANGASVFTDISQQVAGTTATASTSAKAPAKATAKAPAKTAAAGEHGAGANALERSG
jgi:hypothetical protein